MRRPLTTLVSLVLLLPFLAVGVLWVRSHVVSDYLVKTNPGGRHYELVTIPGQIRVTFASNWPSPHRWRYFHREPPNGYLIVGQQAIYHGWYPIGIAVHDDSRRAASGAAGTGAPVNVTYRTFAIPVALPLAVMFAGPAWLVLRARRNGLRRRDRLARGLCGECGYDLRASGGRCPECGAGQQQVSV